MEKMSSRQLAKTAERIPRLRGYLEKLYARLNRPDLIKPDPLQFVYRYKDPADREIAGLLAALLAYGRVAQIEKSVDRLLGKMGDSPAAFVREFDRRKRRNLADFRHRFNTGDDISDLIEQLKYILSTAGGLEAYFLKGYKPTDKNVAAAIGAFCGSILKRHAEKNGGHVSRGVKYLITDPTKGSAAKRINLFLRWMVRNDAVDAGVWKSVEKSKLLVPMDVHMSRISRVLGLHNRKNISIKAAVEVTDGFAEIEPADPVKYDFALCRVGMEQDCACMEQLQRIAEGNI